MKTIPRRSYPVPFRVVVAFDDLSAGRHALAVMNKVLENHESKLHLVPILWRFDELEVSLRREHAAEDGLGADLLIVSTSSQKELPPAVTEWASTVMTARRNTDLVTLFGGERWNVSLANGEGGHGVLAA